MNTSLTFSPNTGALQKYCITSESNVQSLMQDAKKAADSRTEFIGDLKKAKADKGKGSGGPTH
jgi:hypothetical protein